MEAEAMTDDQPERPVYFSGEDELAALLLQMVIEHCGTFSPEKSRTMTSFLSPDPSPGEWLDSYRRAANQDAMDELARQGLIEIVEKDDQHIIAKVTPEGRTLLNRFRTRQRARPGDRRDLS
jgi:hypothetical protein